MRDKKIAERRSIARVPLDIPYFVSLEADGGASCKAMLHNISADGLQLDLPANADPAEFPVDAGVKISGFPPELEHLNGISGTLIWAASGCCGLRFERPLADAAFQEAIDSL